MKSLVYLLMACACASECCGELRKVDGVVSDTLDHPWKSYEWKIVQIIGQDALVRSQHSDDLCYLKNVPNIDRKLDGDTFNCQVLFVGAKEYLSVLGANKRVAAYDAGIEPTSDEVAKWKAKRRAENEARYQVAQAEALLRAERENKQKQEESKQKQEALRLADEKRAALTAKVVAFQLTQASNGLPSFQLELGRRYLRGEGVKTNIALALHWLRSACTNGESQASNLLSQIRQ